MFISKMQAFLRINNKSTAVEQAVACAPVNQRGWIPGQDKFPGSRLFWGFSSPVRQTSGCFRPTRSTNIVWPSYSPFHIHLVIMNGCVNGAYRLSCSCCLEGGPGIELIPHPERPSVSLCRETNRCIIES